MNNQRSTDQRPGRHASSRSGISRSWSGDTVSRSEADGVGALPTVERLVAGAGPVRPPLQAVGAPGMRPALRLRSKFKLYS